MDIAVPRDIDPAADDVENVYLYNIDHLQNIVDENIKNRRREALKAEAIIEEEAANYVSWLKELEAENWTGQSSVDTQSPLCA